MAYLLEGVKDLWSIRAEHLRFETDAGVFEDNYIFGAISNTTSVGGVLTLDVPAEVATFRTTIEDMQALQSNGVKTLVLVTEKNTTTLNLSLLCEGQKSGTRVTLRHLGSSATLSVGLRCRRDLLIGR